MKSKTEKLLDELVKLHPKYIDLSLDRLKLLLKKLDNPQNHLPKTIHITSQEIREEALREVVSQIVDLVKNALDRCQPEHSADLIDRGIVLAGGGALIRGLDQVISDATGLSVIQAEDPLCCVANGTGKFLNLLGNLSREQVDRLVTQ